MDLDLETRRALHRRAWTLLGSLAASVTAVVWWVASGVGSAPDPIPVWLALVVLGCVVPLAGPQVPVQAVRPLLRSHEAGTAVVVHGSHSPVRPPKALMLRIGDDYYVWSAHLPWGTAPRAGDVLTLHGDVRDGGWVLALDAAHGASYPKRRLRLQEAPVVSHDG
ncbi:hypothetical protein [Mumia quercus]|uniref:hypothetical protein n=1 Tax=Mumia quercus TaxID=2976125 RepID=UPI0021CED648|nr:hypothetical protein [Mumia quercus]